ncbi:MAG TPA: hypothetical protein VEL05_03005, partial [Candidatus Acidoferrum sp.]|nr:hypothetical protein [Candidatus Acidoferrum sp.]
APLLWLTATLEPMLWAWDRLPEPMASHWGLWGPPDGCLPRAQVLAIELVMAGLSALAAFVVTRRAPARRWQIAPPLALATFAGLIAVGMSFLLVAVNLDAPSWKDAGPLPVPWLAASLGGPALVAALVSRAAARLETVAEPPAVRASVGLGATERAVWTGSAGNPWFATIGLALVCAGLVALPLAFAPVAATLLFTGCVFGTLSVVHVRADESGLLLSYGPLRFPRQRVRLARIRAARAIDVVPLRHGGWGYRGSLAIFRRAAVVIRRGPGIELDLGRGLLVITVDDADTAAGLLNDLVDRRRAAIGG